MARKKKANPNEDVQGDIIYDRMPGADAITKAVSYTHLTLPTTNNVKISVVAESLKKK